MSAFVTVQDALTEQPARVHVGWFPCASPSFPPLVVVGGTTQTLGSWTSHVRALAKDRSVLVVETRGQGQTELSLEDCTLPVQARDLWQVVRALDVAAPIDLCGFSFGGQVALQASREQPHDVRRLVLTGVGLGRDDVADIIVRGWAHTLATGNLEALAWVSLADIVGPTYLRTNAKLAPSIVRATIERNSYAGIVALFRDVIAPVNKPALSLPMPCPPTLVMGGVLDRVAAPSRVQALAQALGATLELFDDVGHTVPVEAATPWRTRMLAFLDNPATPA